MLLRGGIVCPKMQEILINFFTMNVSKKLVAAVCAVLFLVTACGGTQDPVLSYNASVLEAYSVTNDAVGKMFDDLSTELDKGDKATSEALNTIVTEGTKAAKDGIAAIRVLTPPDAPGVKEFDGALKIFVVGVEEALEVTNQFFAAVKAGEKAKANDLEQKLSATFEKVSKLEDSVITAQEEMAKKNNIELE